MKIRIIALTLVLLTILPGFAFEPIQIMPLGDSITKGAVDPAPSESGYRARLFELLNGAHIRYLFIGIADYNSNDAMKAAGQQFHNGFGSWTMKDLFDNLDGNHQPSGAADGTNGGYFMVGGTGALRKPAFPDLVLLLGGTNDLGQGADENTMEKRLTDLVEWFRKNRPKARVFVGTVLPRGASKPDYESYNQRVLAFNRWLALRVRFFGPQFQLVDLCALFNDAAGHVKNEQSPDGIFLQDGIHPSHNGYVAMGDAWFKAMRPSLGLPAR